MRCVGLSCTVYNGEADHNRKADQFVTYRIYAQHEAQHEEAINEARLGGP